MRRICKLFTLFLILSTLLILSSCDILYLFSSGIHETEDRLVDQLIQCLETEDKEGMRKLFASAQIENSSTFDSDMEELFSFYDGELEYRGGLVNTTDYSDGIQFSYKFFDMQYVVRTSHTSYEFLILWYVEYDYKGKDLGNVGIWSLIVLTRENYQNYNGSLESISGIHIIYPETPEEDLKGE